MMANGSWGSGYSPPPFVPSVSVENGNLANPLSWTFWLATGTPTMLRAQQLAGTPGLVVFTVTWFVVAVALETCVALAVVLSGRVVGGRGLAGFSAVSAAMFVVLAGNLVLANVVPGMSAMR